MHPSECNRICQRTFVIKYLLFPYHITKIQKRLHIAIHFASLFLPFMLIITNAIKDTLISSSFS